MKMIDHTPEEDCGWKLRASPVELSRRSRSCILRSLMRIRRCPLKEFVLRDSSSTRIVKNLHTKDLRNSPRASSSPTLPVNFGKEQDR